MNTRDSSPPDSESGFSLAEVLIAIALLGLLAVGTSALLTQLVDGTDRRRSEFLAQSRATAVMDSLLRRQYADLDVGTGTGSGPLEVQWTVDVSQEDTDLRRIAVTAVADGQRTRLETLISNRFEGVP